MTDATEYDDEGNAELWIDTPDYNTVVGQVSASLQAISDRLKLLREQKERIREEIKRLVSQEHMLRRMAKIASKEQPSRDAAHGA